MNGPELFEVALRLASATAPPPGQHGSYQAYGLVLRLLEMGDAGLARSIHASDGVKPLSVAPPSWRQSKNGGSWGAVVRVGALRPEVFDALAGGVLAAGEKPLDLGGLPVRLAALETGPGIPGTRGCATYAALLEGADGHQTLPGLRFLTPTAFRSRGANVAMPTGDLVFGGLVRRWSALAPIPVPERAAAELVERLLPLAFSLRTRQVDFGSYQQTGVVGFCRYDSPHGLAPDTQRWAMALQRFAVFAGVGAKTTMGMGQTRLLPRGS